MSPAPSKPRPAILFDLDGTLTDPVVGITRSVQFAMRQLGEREPKEADLHSMIGPPLRESLATLVGDGRADEAVRLYRERYSTVGLYENNLYVGVEPLLSELVARGHRLYVATSKLRIYAEKIIAHFDLARFFVRVYGAELDGTRADKAELIEYLLRQEAIAPSGAIMVGDRRHDIIGAKRSHVFVIAAAWGYGSPEEFAAAGPDAVAQSPAEVLALVRAFSDG